MRTFQLAHEGGSVIPGGPFADDDVRRLWQEGQLDRSTLYWSESAQDWKPLATLFPVEIEFEPDEVETHAPTVPQTAPLPQPVVPGAPERYRRPLLSSIFVAIALLVLIGGAITSGMAIAAATKSNSFPPLSTWTVLLLPLGSCLLSALILFAWAQILDYLARTAFHAERAANALSHDRFF